MGEENAEVRISLVADDLSDAVVKAVKQGMTELREETEKARDAAGEKEGGLASAIFKSELKFAALKEAAELVTASIHEAYEMTEMLADAAMEAAEAQEQQERAMAGNLFLMDRGAHSMGEIRDYAKDTREEFAQFGVQVGVSTAKIAEAYDALISKGTMGSEQAKELATQMAVVGKVVPGGMESLAQGFSMVELGMVRARNPVVQLIAATHVLQGNAHSVAAAMMKMSPEQQMKLGEEAIRRQSKALGEFGQNIGAPSMEEVRTSLEGIKEQFLESMGEPMKEAIVPRLVEVRNFLVAHIEQIRAFGEKLGESAAHVIGYVSDAIQGIEEGIAQDWGEIQKTFEDIFGEWENAWGNARKDTKEIHTEFRVMADDFVQLMKPVLAGIKAAAEMAMDANDAINGHAMGTTQAQIQGRAAAERATNAVDGAGGMASVDDSIQKYRQLATEAGMAPDQIERYTASIRASAEANQQASEKARDALGGQNYEQFSGYLESAIKVQAEGAQEFAFAQIEHSEMAKQALLDGSIHIAGGLDALMEVIQERAPKLAAELNDMRRTLKEGHGIQAPQHNINFIGSHFDIHQDFKDQDPERVVAVFKRGLVRSATARIESRVATPFGV